MFDLPILDSFTTVWRSMRYTPCFGHLFFDSDDLVIYEARCDMDGIQMTLDLEGHICSVPSAKRHLAVFRVITPFISYPILKSVIYKSMAR